MRSGILLQCPVKRDDTHAAAYAGLQAEVTAAEAYGFDTCWLSEGHGVPRFCGVPAPLLMLASLTSITTRIGLGTAAVLVPYYRPDRLVEQAAMIDCLSNGRLRLGIGDRKASAGRGRSAGPPGGRDLMQEILDTMDACWRRGEGDEPDRFPHPVQERAPLHVVCNSPTTAAWAARRSRPIILTSMNHGLSETLLDMVGLYRRNAARDGSGSPGVSIVFACYVSESEADLRGTLLGSLSEYLETTGGRGPAADYLFGSVIAGSKAACRRQIAYVASVTGADELVFWFNPGGLIPRERVFASMASVGEILNELKIADRGGWRAA